MKKTIITVCLFHLTLILPMQSPQGRLNPWEKNHLHNMNAIKQAISEKDIKSLFAFMNEYLERPYAFNCNTIIEIITAALGDVSNKDSVHPLWEQLRDEYFRTANIECNCAAMEHRNLTNIPKSRQRPAPELISRFLEIRKTAQLNLEILACFDHHLSFE